MSSRIMGVDPGTLVTGYGIIEEKSRFTTAIAYGALKPCSKLPLAERYHFLFEKLKKLIEDFSPEAIAVESQFVHKNVQSAIKLGMAKGMVLLLSAMYNIPVFEYAPKKAKLAVVGSGFASKSQVQSMVKKILQLPDKPIIEDITDALSLAITHLHQASLSEIRRDYVRVLSRKTCRKRS